MIPIPTFSYDSPPHGSTCQMHLGLGVWTSQTYLQVQILDSDKYTQSKQPLSKTLKQYIQQIDSLQAPPFRTLGTFVKVWFGCYSYYSYYIYCRNDWNLLLRTRERANFQCLGELLVVIVVKGLIPSLNYNWLYSFGSQDWSCIFKLLLSCFCGKIWLILNDILTYSRNICHIHTHTCIIHTYSSNVIQVITVCDI